MSNTQTKGNIARELEDSLQGVVDFSDAGRALYTSDASNYRQVPLGVVFPVDAADVERTNLVCSRQNVPVLMRGGGTSQNGQCVNNAVVLDCSRFMDSVVSIDADAKTAVVQPGVVCDQLKAAAEVHGLTFGPDPATHSRCTLGGMIGNNSCGPHSMLAGKTVENVEQLDILTVDGARFTVGPTSDDELQRILKRDDRQAQIYRELLAIRDEYADLIREKYPIIKRRVSGYNLDQLLPENGFNVARALVGTEGTCVSILEAKVHLINNPRFKQLIVLGFADIFEAGDSVPAILPFAPIAMEGLDWSIVGGLIDRQLRLQEVALLPEGKAWIMMELAADDEPALSELCERFCSAIMKDSTALSCLPINEPHQVAQIWSIREQGASATSMSLNPQDPDPAVGWEDTAVDPHQLGDYLREFQALVDRYDYKTSLYGHFGDGCIHARITFDTRSVAGVEKWRRFSLEIATLVVKYGGSLSGEHGDGQAKAEFLPIMYGDELVGAFERFKKAWDPHNIMNPGKVVNPYRMDENLRLGPDYKTPVVDSVMQFVDDPGGLGRSLERCIGMGKCRAHHGAMCPTYQASREERYSTRGRAHLLHELMRGEVISKGWDDENVEDSLAHCLSCKACKVECPTSVDIASYKSEFMSRHYQRRSRPLHQHVFGKLGNLLPKAAPLAVALNPLLRFPLFSSLVKKALDIAPDKELPLLASKSLRQRLPKLQARFRNAGTDSNFYWFGRDTALDDSSVDIGANEHSRSVVLWVDSFNSHYRPEIIETTIELLTGQGFDVGVSRSHFCCGRPLYEYGFLEQAQTQINSILDSFYSVLPGNADVIVLEPSCLSVFRDEMLKLKSDDPRATDLSSRCITLADLLVKHEIKPARKLPKGLLHLHCHHKSTANTSADRDYLQNCFESLEEPEPGCCGMAGAFGIQQRTRALGKKIFAKKLQVSLDKLQTGEEVAVVSNGFSCHEQFSDAASVQSLHPVQIYSQCLTTDDGSSTVTSVG